MPNITLYDLVKRTGLSESTVRRYLKRHKPPWGEIGRNTAWKDVTIEEFDRWWFKIYYPRLYCTVAFLAEAPDHRIVLTNRNDQLGWRKYTQDSGVQDGPGELVLGTKEVANMEGMGVIQMVEAHMVVPWTTHNYVATEKAGGMA